LPTSIPPSITCHSQSAEKACCDAQTAGFLCIDRRHCQTNALGSPTQSNVIPAKAGIQGKRRGLALDFPLPRE
jgi:hypothetical protein